MRKSRLAKRLSNSLRVTQHMTGSILDLPAGLSDSKMESLTTMLTKLNTHTHTEFGQIWKVLVAGFRHVLELKIAQSEPKKLWLLSNLKLVGHASCKFRREELFPYRCILLCAEYTYSFYAECRPSICDLKPIWDAQAELPMLRNVSWVLLTLTRDDLHVSPSVNMWPHCRSDRVRPEAEAVDGNPFCSVPMPSSASENIQYQL